MEKLKFNFAYAMEVFSASTSRHIMPRTYLSVNYIELLVRLTATGFAGSKIDLEAMKNEIIFGKKLTKTFQRAA